MRRLKSAYAASELPVIVATGLGPDGLPARFEGGAWVSQDRRYYWDGVAWILIKSSSRGPWLTRAGVVVLFAAVIGYALYTVVATQNEFTAGYVAGVFVFFLLLVAVFRAVGRWGCFGYGIRAVTVVLAVLKVLTLIAHPLPR